jgi:hypothetical protein
LGASWPRLGARLCRPDQPQRVDRGDAVKLLNQTCAGALRLVLRTQARSGTAPDQFAGRVRGVLPNPGECPSRALQRRNA